jgi:valyl-tRNA synthetase
MDTIQDYKILYSNLLLKYEELQKEYEHKINELKEHLKKYTSPSRNKKYYENHRDEIIQKSKEYKEKTGNKKAVLPEKIKEYNKKAYEKRKLKKLENI